MRTSIGVPEELWREIRKKKVDVNMTLSEIATEALKQWLESHRIKEGSDD